MNFRLTLSKRTPETIRRYYRHTQPLPPFKLYLFINPNLITFSPFIITQSPTFDPFPRDSWILHMTSITGGPTVTVLHFSLTSCSTPLFLGFLSFQLFGVK